MNKKQSVLLAREDRIEICFLCKEELNFPETVEISAEERWLDGRVYVEGVGQLCAACPQTIYSHKTLFDMKSG